LKGLLLLRLFCWDRLRSNTLEFVQAISPEIDQSEAVQTSSSWKSPPFGVLKANWDVAVNSKEQLVGVGVVIRSHEGAVKAAFHAVEKGITDPAAA
jgi:hypothetical protein